MRAPAVRRGQSPPDPTQDPIEEGVKTVMAKIDDRLMTPAEVARYFDVDAKTVGRWAREGRLTIARTTPGGHRRFWESDVIAAAARGQDDA